MGPIPGSGLGSSRPGLDHFGFVLDTVGSARAMSRPAVTLDRAARANKAASLRAATVTGAPESATSGRRADAPQSAQSAITRRRRQRGVICKIDSSAERALPPALPRRRRRLVVRTETSSGAGGRLRAVSRGKTIDGAIYPAI